MGNPQHFAVKSLLICVGNFLPSGILLFLISPPQRNLGKPQHSCVPLLICVAVVRSISFWYWSLISHATSIISHATNVTAHIFIIRRDNNRLWHLLKISPFLLTRPPTQPTDVELWSSIFYLELKRHRTHRFLGKDTHRCGGLRY